MNFKKIVLRAAPYVCIALYATKIGQAWRLAAGTAFAEKVLHWSDGFMQAFASPLPSFYPHSDSGGVLCGGLCKGQKRKEVPAQRRIRFGALGDGEGHRALRRPRVCQQHHPDADGKADDEQPPQRPSNGAKQKRAGGRRFGQRQDEILRQTEPHAVRIGEMPLFVRCDRPERVTIIRIERS